MTPSLNAVSIMLQSLKSQIDSSVESMRRLLQRPIRLNDGGLKRGTSESKLRQQQREAKRQRVRQMRRDLYALFNQHPSSRKLMRHLATVERTLQEEGLQGFEALPLAVITKALAELEGMVRDWSPTGLAELRSRMAVLAKNRPPQGTATAGEQIDLQAGGPLGREAAAEVTEVDHAEFEEMERSWVGVVPKQPGQPTTA
jgi:hypothetical protein